jgi:hypothetical protein
MTYSINGIGTGLTGVRDLTEEEIEMWESFIPNIRETKIATKTFKCTIPLFPLESFVFYPEYQIRFGKKSDKILSYSILFYPVGKGKVYWEHYFETFTKPWNIIGAVIAIALMCVFFAPIGIFEFLLAAFSVSYALVVKLFLVARLQFSNKS